MLKSFIADNAHSSREVNSWFTLARFALFLSILILVLFPDVLLGGRTFIFRDFSQFGYPLAFHYRESFWRGEIPLWNPLNDCGSPFLAQWNTLVLYPGSLFYLLLPLQHALGLFNLFHLFLCGVSMYALAWRWTGHRLAASVAGLAFAFNGFTLNCLMWPNYIASMAWMPVVVLTVERAWRQGGRHLVLAALAGAMQMLSGTPEIILLTWLLLAALWLIELLGPNQPRKQMVLRMAVVVILVAGLAAAQLLPFLDFMRFTQRSTSAGLEQCAMPITGWANFLVPLFRMTRSSPGVYLQADQTITSSYYLGITMMALASLAVLRVPDKRVRLCAAITVVCLVLALGHAGGLYSLFLRIFPPLRLMRFPIKFVILPVFLVPLLAAYALRGYVDAAPDLKRRYGRSGLGVVLIFVVGIGALIAVTIQHPAKDEVWLTTALSGVSRAAFLITTLGMLHAMVRIGHVRFKWLLTLGVLLFIWLDAATHTPRQNPTVDAAVFEPGFPPVVELVPRPALGQSRAMLSLEAIRAQRNKLLTNVAEGYLVNRLGMCNNVNLLDDLPKVDGFFALVIREEADLSGRLYPTAQTHRVPLADFLSVSQITSATNLFQWNSRSSCLPMATAGQKPIFLDPTNTLEALLSPDFHPRSTVYLRPEDRPYVSVTSQTSAQIISSNWLPHRVSLEVAAATPSLVVIAQAFYHNWHAYVGGKPARLLRANYAFQALEVPAGRQQVILVYEDRLFKVGIVLSCLSAACCLVIWNWRQKHRCNELQDCENESLHLATLS